MQVIQLDKWDFTVKPCPFCGSQNLWAKLSYQPASFVECSNCFTRGPLVGDFPKSATSEQCVKIVVREWNNRKKPTWHVANRPRKKKGA